MKIKKVLNGLRTNATENCENQIRYPGLSYRRCISHPIFSKFDDNSFIPKNIWSDLDFLCHRPHIFYSVFIGPGFYIAPLYV